VFHVSGGGIDISFPAMDAFRYVWSEYIVLDVLSTCR